MIQPNLHVALVHVPIGLLAIGLLIEIFSICYRVSTVRIAARWMIGLGAMAMIPTALSGVYAISDVARRSTSPGDAVDVAWVDVLRNTDLYAGKTGPADTEGDQWRLIGGHVWRMAPATLLAVILVMVWGGSSDRWRKRLYFPVGLLLVLSAGVMIWGASMGGESVYRFGTAVQLHERRSTAAPIYPTTAPGAAREMTTATTPKSIEYYIPPLQTHILMAGLAIVAALTATTFAFRNAASHHEPLTPEEEAAMLTGVAEPGVRPAVPQDLAMLRSFKPAAAMAVTTVHAPAARFWLLTTVLALAAAALGVWFLADQTDAVSRASADNRSFFIAIWETIKTPATLSGTPTQPTENPLNLNRRLAHVFAGGAIILMPLLMAALAKWAPRRRLVLSLLTIVLVAAIGVQIWLGTLLTLDTPAGSITSFNPPAVDALGR